LHDAGQPELGIKSRGGKQGIELKGLVAAIWDGLTVGPFEGPIELWTKWTSAQLALPSNSTISTEKQRWLRKFDTTGALPKEIPLDVKEQPLDQGPLPARGCNIELTQVRLPDGELWWTLGFEAFGTIQTVERDLRAAATILAARQPPELTGGMLASYPAWLTEHIGEP
jgi:hypothetical protein